MGSVLDRKKLEELSKELAKEAKSQDDLSDLSRELLKITVETALNAELEDHMGYPKHSPEGRFIDNSRNGYSPKTLKSDIGEVETQNPRDRNGTFEPQLIRKGQTRLTKFDDQIISLYARGMTIRDIAQTFRQGDVQRRSLPQPDFHSHRGRC